MNKLLKTHNLGQKTIELYQNGDNYNVKIYISKTGIQTNRFGFDDKKAAEAFYSELKIQIFWLDNDKR